MAEVFSGEKYSLEFNFNISKYEDYVPGAASPDIQFVDISERHTDGIIGNVDLSFFGSYAGKAEDDFLLNLPSRLRILDTQEIDGIAEVFIKFDQEYGDEFLSWAYDCYASGW